MAPEGVERKGEFESTCWTVIHAAAAGSAADRDDFARRYGPVIRAYLASRWRASPCLGELDDAAQETFLERFKQGGMLEKAERGRRGGFRALLYGVVRNVALRFEARRARARERQTPDGLELGLVADSDGALSRLFDRAWARALVQEAARRQEERAREAGAAASRRVELLRLRFQDGLPIRDIAARWGADPADVHHEYAKARREFKSALLDVVAFHREGTSEELEAECAELLALLQ